MNPVTIPSKTHIGEQAQTRIDFLTQRVGALLAENAQLKKEIEALETIPHIRLLTNQGVDLIQTPVHIKYPACFKPLN